MIAIGLWTLNLQTVLGDAALAGNLMSRPTWQAVVERLGGQAVAAEGGGLIADLSLAACFAVVFVAAAIGLLGGAAWIGWRRRQPFLVALTEWAARGWLWWLLPGVWEIARLAAFVLGIEPLSQLLVGTLPLWYATAAAGWLATLVALGAHDTTLDRTKPASLSRKCAVTLGLLVAAHVVAFTAMNWQLWFSLRIPHGDSAMYEEHLWNLTHGKGFRSYLDQGLFLGEHIQVIHLLLLPLHLIWPSHLLLELCGSLALGLGALPVFWIGRRHTGSPKLGLMLAAAYLLYVPMHFLDIAIDLKTFRPTSFEIPLLLFALDQLERRRYGTMAVLLFVALSAQEDFAAVLAPLGLWIALRARALETEPSHIRRLRWTGALIAVSATIYLVLAVTVLIPSFREGANVHYAQYFGELGNTPADIVRAMLRSPGLVMGKLFSLRSILYALMLLVPLGFVPLLAPGRLAVAVPWFAVLCLLELSSDPAQQGTEMLVPFHHFHAQIVPVLLWAACAGLGRIAKTVGWDKAASAAGPPSQRAQTSWWAGARRRAGPTQLGHFIWASALATNFFLGYGPLSLGFWDPGSPAYWQTRYVPDRRAEFFPRVFRLIPQHARVASTDFVHPRFTHHERSYDYSDYPRRVSDYEPRVPHDTDYIVIDTRHPYSEIKRPEQVRELRQEPENWELLPVETDGYFIVLRRKGVENRSGGPAPEDGLVPP